jgi:hypothetical protein
MLYSLRKRKEEFLKRKYLDYKSMNLKGDFISNTKYNFINPKTKNKEDYIKDELYYKMSPTLNFS